VYLGGGGGNNIGLLPNRFSSYYPTDQILALDTYLVFPLEV